MASAHLLAVKNTHLWQTLLSILLELKIVLHHRVVGLPFPRVVALVKDDEGEDGQ